MEKEKQIDSYLMSGDVEENLGSILDEKYRIFDGSWLHYLKQPLVGHSGDEAKSLAIMKNTSHWDIPKTRGPSCARLNSTDNEKNTINYQDKRPIIQTSGNDSCLQKKSFIENDKQRGSGLNYSFDTTQQKYVAHKKKDISPSIGKNEKMAKLINAMKNRKQRLRTEIANYSLKVHKIKDEMEALVHKKAFDEADTLKIKLNKYEKKKQILVEVYDHR